MPVDQNLFFREATLRICGNLEAEGFLADTYQYLSTFLPLRQLVLSYYDPGQGKQTILAEATAQGGRMIRQTLILPEHVQRYSSRPGLDTLVIDRAATHPTAQPWIAAGHLDKAAALIVMRVFVRKDMIGAVIFIAPPKVRFTKQHEGLVKSLRKPFAIALANCARYQELMALKELLTEDYRDLQNDYIQSVGREIVGARFGLKPVMDLVRQVSPLNSPVLLLGESGTGKELIAAAIHHLSSRKDQPFVKVNCGAIPESLIDAELFGHEKGAFTGALNRKRGRFERAHGGTIFLDEIGELKPEVQVRLLRVLQEKEIERVGGVSPVRVDIRVIAATHRNLDRMVAQNRFRQDLYFRLKVFPIAIPPLRARRSDIPSLVDHFIAKRYRDLGLRNRPHVAPGVMDRIVGYDWPGNVRELENTMERALILSRGRAITPRDIGLPLAGAVSSRSTGTSDQPALEQTVFQPLEEMIARHIIKALKITGGQVGGKSGAGELLGINPSTLRKKMRKLGIPFGRTASVHYRNHDNLT